MTEEPEFTGGVQAVPIEKSASEIALAPISHFSFELPLMGSTDLAVAIHIGDEIGFTASPIEMVKALLDGIEDDYIGWYAEREFYVADGLRRLAAACTEAADRIDALAPVKGS
jgi:hypothetical protein